MELRAEYGYRCNRPVCPECEREEQARGRRVGVEGGETRRTGEQENRKE
jgi:hypothetical protein